MMYPKWATPERRAHLVELLTESRGLCVHGHPDCGQLGDSYSLITKLVVVPRRDPKAPFNPLYRDEVSLTVEVVPEGKTVKAAGHCYELESEEAIATWKADDRGRRQQLRKLENRHLHAVPQLWKRGEFDTIRREQYLADRPVWHIVAIGINALIFKRVAQVEIPGLKRTLWVDISGIKLEGVSKNKLRKLARYKRGAIPKGLVEQVEQRVAQQVARVL